MIRNIKHHLMGKSRDTKFEQFLSLTRPNRDSTLLDVGVADQEYSPFDNYLEKRYPYPHNITALSIHPLEEFSKRYPDVKAVSYKGGKFPFKDKQFSIVFSNAVIEHVGDFHKQLFFIKEMKRVGHQFYFLTPAKEFPIEMHTNYPFIHWFPDTMFNKIVTWLGKGWASGDYMNLLKKKDLQALLKASDVRHFRIFTHSIGPLSVHYAAWGR